MELEAERQGHPHNDDEATSGHMEIATLFEQSIQLIGQGFNVITYHRWLNLLNTLIDNSIKVNEILKEGSFDMDDMENPYLFGEKFEEKLIKIASAKQKSKSIFISLQQSKPIFSSRPNYNQPFLSGAIPGNQQGRSASGRVPIFFFSRAAAARGKDLPSSVYSTESGNPQSRNILTHTSCNQRCISSKGVLKVFTGGSSPVFFRKPGETYKQPLHSKYSESVLDSLSVSACSEIFSPTYFSDHSGKGLSGPGDRTNVKERCNKRCATRFPSSQYLWCPKRTLFIAQ